MTISELVNRAKRPDLAKILIMDSLSLDEKSFFLKRNQELAPTQTKLFLKSYRRLEASEPVQYITGTANFYGREFKVNKNVLIPRPETEILLQQAIKNYEFRIKNYKKSERKKFKVIDIGTGSGCIIISLAKELRIKNPELRIDFYGVEISSKALKVAKENAKRHDAKIKFSKSNLLTNERLPRRFNLILANLPYLKTDYPQTITEENQSILFEPKIALDGGENGLKLVKKLISQLPDHLEQNGIAILEVGDDQEKTLREFVKRFSKLRFEYLKDLTNRFRFLKISKIN